MRDSRPERGSVRKSPTAEDELMALIQEYGFTVGPAKEAGFQTWLRDNEAQLHQAVPGGIRYLGTFGVAFSSEKTSGSHRLLLQFDKYGSLDTFSEAMNTDSDFARLMREYFGFVSDDAAAPSSLSLYRSFVDMFV